MKIALSILCILLLAGCDKNESKTDCTPSSQTYTFHVNKSVDTSGHQASLVSGNNTVFKFQYNYEHCPGTAGAFVSRQIYFELPPATQTEFSFVNESLSQANALIYLEAPINPILRVKSITQGSVHGTQISSSKWHVIASVVSGTDTTSIEADFIRQE